MSRLTSAEIIARGEYLEPDFDPASLTVSQLLGIFGYHNVTYPSQYTKPKLVQLFKDEIKPRTKGFKKERLSRQNSQASDDGITDGITGKPVGERKPIEPRRSSRRISRASSRDLPPEPEPEPEPPQAEPPKRRRSSAQPSLGGPSRRRTAKLAEPVVIEESEPEEVVVRKVSKSKKASADAGTQARRVSQTLASDDRDSGWEDNNIFQSGAESSSPARPSPVRTRPRRTSAVATRSRKSMSAPPQYGPPSPTKDLEEEEKKKALRSRAPSVKPPSTSFEPRLPPGMSRERKETRAQREIVVVPDDVQEEVEEVKEEEGHIVEEQAQYLDEIQEQATQEEAAERAMEELGESSEEQYNIAVSRRLAGDAQVARRHPQSEAQSTSLSLRLILTVLALAGLRFLYHYKQESSSIGFCDTGKTTNSILEDMRSHRAAVGTCNQENRTTLYLLPSPDIAESMVSPTPTPTAAEVTEPSGEEMTAAEACPPLPLVPIPHADTCAPCPTHASCSPSTMTCENGYILRPHPLLFFLPSSPSDAGSHNTYTLPSHSQSLSAKAESFPQLVYRGVSWLLDGLPGLGPVALPPRCVEDPRRKRHIGVLGKAVEAMLAAERGRRLCAGVGVGEPVGNETEEAKKWGVEVNMLKEGMRRKTSPHLLNAFEDTFNEAIQQLVQWGGVFMGEDAEGTRYLAHRTPQMDWTCALKVKARQSWEQWQKPIIGLLILVASIFGFQRRQAQNLVENDRVAGLVQIALDLLRNQELAHHTDPVTAPQPYLSSLQLRDLILQEEHSVRARRRLWERVEPIVEGNANVRTNLEEVDGGDEMRVWRWVGGGKTYPATPGRRTIQQENDTPMMTAQ